MMLKNVSLNIFLRHSSFAASLQFHTSIVGCVAYNLSSLLLCHRHESFMPTALNYIIHHLPLYMLYASFNLLFQHVVHPTYETIYNDSYIYYIYSGVPYITIHAQRKARAIWKLVHSIELTEELFLDLNLNVDGSKLTKEAISEDDVDSEDEVDDEGEEGVEFVSLVSLLRCCWICMIVLW